MALLSTFVCRICKRNVSESHPASSYPSVCSKCKKDMEKRELDKFLASRKALSIEERLRLIETWIHNHKEYSTSILNDHF